MKRILLLSLALVTIHCSLLTLDASAQSRTNRIYRSCPGTTTKAQVAIDVAGNITVTPCSGKTVITNGVKVYRALLTQTGTNPPVATVLENSLGVTPTYSYSSVGAYQVTATDVFTLDKTFISMTGVTWPPGTPENSTFFSAQRSNASILEILTMIGAAGGGGAWAVPVQQDGLLLRTEIEILVYP